MSADLHGMVDPAALVERWRQHADALRRFGAGGQADAVDECASQLEIMLQDANGELLGLAAAARESGYSADHLGRLIRSGKLTNYGREHAPRVRRGELPRKPVTVRRLASGPKVPSMETLTREAIASTRRSV